MKNNVNKTDKTLEWVIASVIGIALIFGMYLFREDVNTDRDYQNESYCKMAESDANNIAAAIYDYFSIPEHKTLPTISGDSEYLGYTLSARYGKNQNIAWVTGEAESTITIAVKDGSGKCPDAYQERFPEWDSGKYIKKLE